MTAPIRPEKKKTGDKLSLVAGLEISTLKDLSLRRYGRRIFGELYYALRDEVTSDGDDGDQLDGGKTSRI